ncbi:hypothetical protein ABH930_001154 [Kitasatospora sp. GAS204A]|uniref:hypothetical protein n=1 Tax=unclassified Kitasatospora TaxID=2633591 RepID=UPI002475623B|nr:hypothetical protein [Kitasatospora sp. GAS204B]MDH6119914.1 hypothetical protein [Kitasatospora sp. GAS204B]
MSTNRSRRIDRDAAEQLLAGAVDDTQGGLDALSGLLAAAAAPATTRELAGEEAAVTAFREAARLTAPHQNAVPHQTAVPHQNSGAPSLSRATRSSTNSPASSKPRSRPMASCAPQRFRVPTRFLSAKAAAAAFAVTAIGGVAVAAGTGHLPAALGGPGLSGSTGRADNTAATGSASAAPTSSWAGQAAGQLPGTGRASAGARPLPGGSSTGPSGGAASSGSTRGGTDGGSTPATADPSGAGQSGKGVPPGQQATGGADIPSILLPLCQLWPGTSQPGAADSRFEPLTRAAGGSDRVRTYCAALRSESGKQTSGTSPLPVLPGGTPTAAHPPTPDPGTSTASPPGGDGHGYTPQGQAIGGNGPGGS